MKYRIYDTFNDRTVSTHRTIGSAVKAESKFLRAVRRANGPNSFIPTRIEVCMDDGDWIAAEWIVTTNARLENTR